MLGLGLKLVRDWGLRFEMLDVTARVRRSWAESDRGECS